MFVLFVQGITVQLAVDVDGTMAAVYPAFLVGSLVPSVRWH